MQSSLYQPTEVESSTRAGRDAVDTLAGLLVAVTVLLVLAIRARLMRVTRRRLLVNFFALVTCAVALVGALALVERAIHPIQMFEMSYGGIVHDAPLTSIIMTSAPIVALTTLVYYFASKRRGDPR